jgi:hypothetical protein
LDVAWEEAVIHSTVMFGCIDYIQDRHWLVLKITVLEGTEEYFESGILISTATIQPHREHNSVKQMFKLFCLF